MILSPSLFLSLFQSHPCQVANKILLAIAFFSNRHGKKFSVVEAFVLKGRILSFLSSFPPSLPPSSFLLGAIFKVPRTSCVGVSLFFTGSMTHHSTPAIRPFLSLSPQEGNPVHLHRGMAIFHSPVFSRVKHYLLVARTLTR